MTIIASLLRAADLPDSPTARLDAELLLAAALGKSRSYLHTWPEKIVSSEAALAFADFLVRRRGGEPVAYILGQQGFWICLIVGLISSLLLCFIGNWIIGAITAAFFVLGE